MPPKKRPGPESSPDLVPTKRLSTYATRGSSSHPAPAKDEHPVIKQEEVEIKKESTDHIPIQTRNTLMWFRNDLRINDNRALHAASMRSKVGNRNLIGLFIVSEEEWADHDESPVKIDFWMRNLTCLKDSLSSLDIPLVVKKATSKDQVPGVVVSTVKEMDISHVFWNGELMVDEQRRDATVRSALKALPGVVIEECEDQCIVSPRDVRTKTGNPYTVFTPFYKTWCALVETNDHYLELSEAPESNPPEARKLFADHFNVAIDSSHPHALDAKEIQRLYPAGETAAQDRLKSFLEKKARKYNTARDYPHVQGCSVISPYLTSGVISARQCVSAARAANNNKLTSGDEGLKTWIKEVAWREFYRHILVAFPRVCMNRAFQPLTEKVQWSEDREAFQKWCQGQTGFPIVDAGMRQLCNTGYMHNRLRMIVACFLVKDLLINWQWGEKYFMNSLIDGDLSSNNGGWQWSASTGTDAQPYFRIFNPLLQSQRFDPKGDFIRHWVPELKNLSEKQIHDPFHSLSAAEFKKLGYPKPMVEHAQAKVKYLNEFKRVLALK